MRDIIISVYTAHMIPLRPTLILPSRIATKLDAIICRSRSRYKQAMELKREAQHKREKAATVVQTCWRGYRCVHYIIFKIMDMMQPLVYIYSIYRAKQLFYDLKRDKLEQQLQRDTELKRKQAATSVQAWWRGYRWVVFIVLHSRSCLRTKIVLLISDLRKTVPSSAQGNLIAERRGLRYMYLVLTLGAEVWGKRRLKKNNFFLL